MHLGRRWYLLAWDCEREDWRTFRVDRLRDLRPAGSRFEPRPAPAEDVAAYVTSRLSGAPYRYQARITLHAPAPDVVARRSYFQGRVEEMDERTCELRTSDDVLDWLAVRDRHARRRLRGPRAARARRALRELASRLQRATGAG